MQSPLSYPNILPQSSHTNLDTFLVTGCLTTFSFLLTSVNGLRGFRFAEYVVFTFPWLITSCSTKAWNRLLPQLGQQSKCFGFLSFVNSESSTTTPTIIASNVNMAAIISTSLHNIFALNIPYREVTFNVLSPNHLWISLCSQPPGFALISSLSSTEYIIITDCWFGKKLQ